MGFNKDKNCVSSLLLLNKLPQVSSLTPTEDAVKWKLKAHTGLAEPKPGCQQDGIPFWKL